jgi:hypothetical protein
MSWIVPCQRKAEMFCAVPIRALFAPAPPTPMLAPRKGAATLQFESTERLAHPTLVITWMYTLRRGTRPRTSKNESLLFRFLLDSPRHD